MASGKPQEEAFTPGTLEEFKERFGQVGDRFEHAVHPYLDKVDMPSAEHPKMASAREQAAAAQQSASQENYISDKRSKPDFQAAANNFQAKQGQDRGSAQVQKDAPEQNLPPPENSKPVDWERHKSEMREDDKQSQNDLADSYYEKLDERLKAEAQEYGNDGQERDYGNDFEQSR